MPEFFAKDNGLYIDDKKITLKGLNFFGMETEVYALHGLWQVPLKSLLDFIKTNNFNAVRVPLSVEVVLGFDTLKCKSINTSVNPELTNITPGGLLDIFVKECEKRGILVMPDIHRFTGDGSISELWYDDKNPETKLIEAWKIIVKRYINSPNVFAVDLKNEPHGNASWGSNNNSTDWNKAAERIGNAILGINPKLLIFVEGVERFEGNGGWWGGNLQGVSKYPIKLKIPNKLVYSPHVYGPSVATQPYFNTPTFPKNLPKVWDEDFGYIKKNNLGTIVIGEWGGRMNSENRDDIWQNSLGDYIRENNIDFFYWDLNPNSGDTGGLLEDDWKTPVTKKLQLLDRVCPNPSQFTFATSQQSSSLLATPQQPSKPITPSYQTETPQQPTLPPKSSNVNIEIKDANKWNNGTTNYYQQDVICTNTTNDTIKNIQLNLSLSNGNLEQSWNCQCVVQQTTMMLSFPQWLVENGGLKSGETVKFGYIVKGDKPIFQSMR